MLYPEIRLQMCSLHLQPLNLFLGVLLKVKLQVVDQWDQQQVADHLLDNFNQDYLITFQMT